jgi:hypothetical protein
MGVTGSLRKKDFKFNFASGVYWPDVRLWSLSNKAASNIHD